MRAVCAEQPNSPSSAAKIAAVDAGLRQASKASVELRETSMAWVFLTADRVYKMKKPVRRRIFDFTRLEQRHHACVEELRLNRRLAPDVYLGLSRLTRASDGTLTLDGEGETVDWLVRMRRLEETLFLDHALVAGTATRSDIAGVGARLATFHKAAPAVSLSRGALLGRYREDMRETSEILENPTFVPFAGEFRKLLEAMSTFVDRRSGLLFKRLELHRIVEGHGDLRPEHVWLGPPVLIIDCLESSRPLRLLDPFEEYATLAMECAVLGASWVSEELFEHVRRALDDEPDPRVVAFYTAHRATLRARQALAHLLVPKPRTPERWEPLTRRYLDQAARAAAILETQ